MRIVPLFVALLIGVATAPEALAADGAAIMAQNEMKWADAPPVLPSGAQIALLYGNPQKAEPFAFRLKFPANYAIPAHTHSIAEIVTIISGTLNFGHGEALDRKATRAVSAGGFVAIPAGHPHFVWTDGDVVVQINGNGPFDIKYMNPADDPTAKQTSN